MCFRESTSLANHHDIKALTRLSLDLSVSLVGDWSLYEVDVLVDDSLDTVPAGVECLISEESVLQASVLELKPGEASCDLLIDFECLIVVTLIISTVPSDLGVICHKDQIAHVPYRA